MPGSGLEEDTEQNPKPSNQWITTNARPRLPACPGQQQGPEHPRGEALNSAFLPKVSGWTEEARVEIGVFRFSFSFFFFYLF